MYSRTLSYTLLVLLTLLLLVLLLVGLLFVDTALSVWQRVQALPEWIGYGIGGGVLLLSLGFGWVMFRLFRGGRAALPRQEGGARPTRESLERAIEKADRLGANTAAAADELDRLDSRKAAGTLHIALFGEVSSGKSSVVRALLPEAQATSGVVGGTTRSIQQYDWCSAAGDRLVLVDMPGLREAGGGFDLLASEEALRAHLVVYLCEGDLTRSQFGEIGELVTLGKPLVIAINKSDRYTEQELARIREQVEQRLSALDAPRLEVVAIRSGGRREVIRVGPDLSEQREVVQLAPEVEGLRRAIQRIIEGEPAALETLRDHAVFVLASRRVEESLAEVRRRQAEALVQGYAKKAVAGALAAITPGTDLLIQGWLATRMVKELSALYEVPVRQVDLDDLLAQVQSRTSREAAVILAIVGNALKSFPGVGTLAGGAVHAVAYGVIFDALGRSVAASLESRGELSPHEAAGQFTEVVGEHLDLSAKRIAGLALEEVKKLGRER